MANEWVKNNANESGSNAPAKVKETPKVEKVKETPKVEKVVDGLQTLEFETYGWCEELKRSYKKGLYKPKNEKEFKALKKYAKKG